MLIDTHCHLTMSATYKKDLRENNISQEITNIYKESATSDVIKIIDVGTTVTDSLQAVQLAVQNQNIYAAIGIHPCDITSQWLTDVTTLQRLYQKTPPGRIVAIGECGIDLYHQPADLAQQKDLFYAQIELALAHQLPIIIHSRNAPEETLACVDRYASDELRGVMHCFSYNAAIARDVTSRGLLLGIGGTITYPKNNELREIVQSVTLEQFVLETDAPFLTPQPWRGQTNHPQYIRYIAEFIANLRNDSLDNIATQTTHNATKLFNLQ